MQRLESRHVPEQGHLHRDKVFPTEGPTFPFMRSVDVEDYRTSQCICIQPKLLPTQGQRDHYAPAPHIERSILSRMAGFHLLMPGRRRIYFGQAEKFFLLRSDKNGSPWRAIGLAWHRSQVFFMSGYAALTGMDENATLHIVLQIRDGTGGEKTEFHVKGL